MDIVNLTRNAEVLNGGQINSLADMHVVQAWCEGKGYACHVNLDASNTPTMGITAPGGNTSQSAQVGDWIVLKNGVTVTVVPAEQAPSLYSIAP